MEDEKSPFEKVLAHYGIPGMKWGIRRTDAQLSKSKAQVSEDYAKAQVARSKPASQLSNQEMQELITRMNLEQQYAKLVSTPPKDASRIQKGKAFVTSLIVDVGKTELTRVAKAEANLRLQEAFKKRGKAELAKAIKPKAK